MKRFLFSVTLAVLLSIGFYSYGASQDQQVDDIHEAVLRVVVPKSKLVCYVAFGTEDPSDAFIQRMRKQNVLIEKMSLSPIPFQRTRNTAKLGKNPMLMVHPIEWVSSEKAEVVVDWPVAGTRYMLQQSDGHWKITSKRMEWIS